MFGGRRDHRHIDDPPPRYPNPSRGDAVLLAVVVAGGLAAATLTARGEAPRTAEACVLSGSVVGWDSVRDTRRAYAEVHVGAIVAPAEYDDGERFAELGVTDGDGTFHVGCADVESPSVIVLAHASWRGCLHVTDVAIPRDGATGLRFEVSDVRMSRLADAAHALGCTHPPFGVVRR